MKRTIVAIFEDDVVNRFIYERLFSKRKEDVELYIFDTPDKGIEMARAVPFDVVFIEVHFWETFGGVPILQKLKEILSPAMIAVAMTALLQKGDLEYLMSAGFTLCVEKPVVFTEADVDNFFNPTNRKF
jgi:CheY-like chemotaxis protein